MALEPMIDPASVRTMEPGEYNLRVWADKKALEVTDGQKIRIRALEAELAECNHARAVEEQPTFDLIRANNRVQALEADLARSQAANAYDAAAHKRVAELEAALRDCVDADAEPVGGSVRAEAIYRARQLLESQSETPGEPLPKLECGMGCGRTFCSPEGRDHHEELCEGRTLNREVKP
jgi:glycyl-tRNA synthetase beta subunit